MSSPSGQQHEISFGDQHAVVTEVGAGLRAFTAAGRAVIDGFPADQMCRSGRGQVLAPWPNRLAGGRYEFDGAEQLLPVTEPRTGAASHGLVRWESWAPTARDSDRVAMRCRLHPRPGYPFALELTVEYQLSADGLRVTTTATNVGSARCPFGLGFHPYLSPAAPTIDPERLTLPARSVLALDERGVPTGAQPVAGGEFDFRTPRPIGSTAMDHCFTDLDRGPDGIARVTLAGTTLWVDEGFGYLMLFTGDGRADVDRRAIAVEPMTCPPDAFNSGDSLLVLEPGERWSAAWGIEPHARAAD